MITEFMDNSRFKFRAWNKLQNKMFYVINISWFYEEIKRIEAFEPETKKIFIFDEYDRNIENTILLQSTGLTDKNGKLIYEGDIVKYLDYICEIAYKRGSFILEVRKGKKDGFFHFYDMHNSFLDVIGNIYEDNHLIENPELLKEC